MKKSYTYSATKEKLGTPIETANSYNSNTERILPELMSTDSVKLKHALKEKEREIEALQIKVLELKKEINANKVTMNHSYGMMSFEIQNSINFGDIEKEDVARQKQILSGLIFQTHETLKMLKYRANSMVNVINMIEPGAIGCLKENEFSKLKSSLEELANTLMETSKTEVDLGLKFRENEKKTHELVKLNLLHKDLRGQYNHLLDQHTELKKRMQGLEEKLQASDKDLEQQKHKNAKSEKQIELLEKRIELILETDIAVDKDKLRKALTELVKENESLKREVIVKNKEIKKNKDDLNKLQNKIIRQTRKIESLTRSKKGQSSAHIQGKDGEGSGNPSERILKDDDLNLLQQNTIPLTLDFRTSSLKLHFLDLLNDIMDQGANVFVNQFNTIESKDKKEAIVFVTNQLINFREFSDKLHFFIRESLEFQRLEEVRDVQIFLGKYFRHIFNSQMLNLWIPDGITGILTTIDLTGKEIRCLGTKGLISDVIKNGKPYNKRHMKNSYICELTSSAGKYKVDNTLIIPIRRNAGTAANGRVIGALEISNIADSHFGFDEEYFAITLGQLVSTLLYRINIQTVLVQEHRLKDVMLSSFGELTACKTKYELFKQIKECGTKIFGISSANFVFVENGKFVIYKSENETKEYEATIGLSGHVYTTQRGLIITDVASSKEYNSLVDMVSIMPIYFAPVLVKNDKTGESEIKGIFQMLLKPKDHKNSERVDGVDEILAHIGVEEATENLVNRYCTLVANSISIFEKNRSNQ